MEELNSSMEEAELSKTLKKLQSLEIEKGDMVLGFIKEKEIIENIHQEQLEQLKAKHFEEIEAIRRECLKERENLLRESDSRQVDEKNRQKESIEKIKKKIKEESKKEAKQSQEGFRNEKRKLRKEYEVVVAQKTAEIEELYRENCILRSKADPESFENKNKNAEVMINKLKSEINALENEKLKQALKLKDEFQAERAELERKHVREKAEFVKKLTSKYNQQHTSNEIEKSKFLSAFQKEVEEKIEIVENLWEERNTEDRNKMATRLENEIAMLKRRFSDDLKAKLLEKEKVIENLEREKENLLNCIHIERFELAKVYNRELSILNRLDSPSKEDIEFALIDEVAKLRDEQQRVVRDMEKNHKRKMRDLKKEQKTLDEIEEKHRNDLEELRNNYEKEKEEFEAKLRNEQLNLLKSFEFEKNDIERYFKQLIDERENEFETEFKSVQSKHDEALEKLNLLEKENSELKTQLIHEQGRSEQLSDKLQEYESQNARLQEELERGERSKREPVEETCVLENDKESLNKTVEQLSSLNVQLSDELEKERKKCENLLEKVNELETEKEILRKTEKTDAHSSESGLELSSSTLEKHEERNTKDNSNAERSVIRQKPENPEEKREFERNDDFDKQTKLQGSFEEYLFEIKLLQDGINLKEMENNQLRKTYTKEKSELNEKIQYLNDELKNVVVDENIDNEDMSIEDLKTRHMKLTDAINQIVEKLDSQSNTSVTHEASSYDLSKEQKDFYHAVNALDDLLSDDITSEVKEKLSKKLKKVKNNIMRSRDLENLEQQRKHEQEKNKYLKELTDERHKELDVSEEVWNAVCEKVGLDEELSKGKLKGILQEKVVGKETLESQSGKANFKSDYDDLDAEKKREEEKETADFNDEEMKNLKEENERLQDTLNELEKHYRKEKEELMEKLQTQHQEFVLSSEADIIEKLIKEKSALEEASNIERFNLGSIYYMEMQDELDDILSQRKEIMDKELEKEKLDILLKFNKDIAELHKLIADKDEDEVKLLNEKNALAKKVLDIQRRMPCADRNENNNITDIKEEAEKLKATLPLKKEIADLQRQRQEEHETNVENLEKAIDFINELLEDNKNDETSLCRRYSFTSIPSQNDETSLSNSPDLPDEEIRSKEDLQKALENLIEKSFSKEKDYAESDPSSGASSDFDSEPNSPETEIEEDVSDSGAESIGHDRISIKKADLDLAMNLERFSLGRIYYNEYKDTLKSALKKLAKERNKNQGLEERLELGIKDLVNRTNFGNLLQPKVDLETQTEDIEKSGKKEQYTEEDEKETPVVLVQEVVKEESFTSSEDAGSENEDEEDLEGDKNLEHKQGDNTIEELIRQDVTTQTREIQGEEESEKEQEIERNEFFLKDDCFPPKESENDVKKRKIVEPFIGKDKSHVLGNQTSENEIDSEESLEDEQKSIPIVNEQTDARNNEDYDSKEEDKENGNKQEKISEPKEVDIMDSNKSNDYGSNEGDKENNNKNDTEKEQKSVNEEKKPWDGSSSKDYNTKDDNKAKEKLRNKGVGQELQKSVANKTDDYDPKDKDKERDALGSRDDSAKDSNVIPESKEVDKEKEKLQNIEDVGQEQKSVANKIDDYDPKDKDKERDAHGSRDDSAQDSNVIPESKEVDKEKEKLQNKDIGQEQKSVANKIDDYDSKNGHRERGAIGKKNDSEQDSNVIPESKTAADIAMSEQCDTNDDQQPSYGQETKKDNDSIHNVENKTRDDHKVNKEEGEQEKDFEVNDQSNAALVLRENKTMKDKFNILKALVGKWFVEEIPVLKTVDKTTEIEGKSNLEDLNENQLKELREEEKFLAGEIKNLENQIEILKDMNDVNNKKEEEKLNDQELLALKQLEKVEKALKKEEDKDLFELLEKEKTEVCKKLEELERDMEEETDKIPDSEKNIFDLMKKRTELEQSVAVQARELEMNQKKLVQIKDGKEEIKQIIWAVDSLEEQKRVLKELLQYESCNEFAKEGITENQPIRREEITKIDTSEDLQNQQNVLPTEKILTSPQVKNLVKRKSNKDKEERQARKKIEKAKRDKERYKRMEKDREERLRPFLKKRQKLQEKMKKCDSSNNNEGDDELSTLDENSKGTLPNKQSTEKGQMSNLNVGEIEKEMMKVSNEMSLLRKNIPSDLGEMTRISAENPKVEELEFEKDDLNAQITEKERKIESMGYKITELSNILQGKAELDVKLVEIEEALPEGYQTLPFEVQEAYKLACLKQELKDDLLELDQEIDEEKTNFKEAVYYQREGKFSVPKSAIGIIFESNQLLAKELEQISKKVSRDIDTEITSRSKHSETEDKMGRKLELEDFINKNLDKIKDEPFRAAVAIGNLIEQKQSKTDSLIKASDSLKEAKDKLRMSKYKEDTDISDQIKQAIALGEKKDENIDQSFEAAERDWENDIKEICEEIRFLKQEDKDTKQKEDEMLDVIEKQKSSKVNQFLSDKEKRDCGITTIPSSLLADNETTKSQIEKLEEKLKAISDDQKDKENAKPVIEELSSLYYKRLEIDKTMNSFKEFADLLNHKQRLAEVLKAAIDRKELNEIEHIVQLKEEEIYSIKAMGDEVDKQLEELSNLMNNNENSEDKLESAIQDAIDKIEKQLLEAEAEKKVYCKSISQEESNIKEAISSLEDELEESREEMEFVENELERFRSLSEDDTSVSSALLELTKLLNSQKSLKEYLFEIDTKLDNCDDSDKIRLCQEEIQALRVERRDAETKLKDLQEQKSKFEIELQDEEIQETYASLCEEKALLEEARKDVVAKIHGSNIFSKMAEELEKDKPNEEEQKYYYHALNQMLSDQKTLIKLAEENERLKEIACKQRVLLENLNNRITESLGEDLAQAITSDSSLHEKPNSHLIRYIIDRIDIKNETVADILDDIVNENKKVIELNEELSNDLDCLKEKVGEKLSDAILQPNYQLPKDKFDPIDGIINVGKTVEEVLEDQRDAIGRLKDIMGENLIKALLKPSTDNAENNDHQEFLKAPKLMRETDDDLETVIAAYESELDNLGKESDLLKNMLGNDLVYALFAISQDENNEAISKYGYVSNVPRERKFDKKYEAGLDNGQLEQEGGYDDEVKQHDKVNDTKPCIAIENEEDKQKQTDKALKNSEEPKDELMNELKDDEEKCLQISNKNKDKTPNDFESQEQTDLYTDVRECLEIKKPTQKPDFKFEKFGLIAPVRMIENNKTLGEIIKGYESALDTLKSRLSPDLYEEILGARIQDKKDNEEDILTPEVEVDKSDQPILSQEDEMASENSAINIGSSQGSENIHDQQQHVANKQDKQTRALLPELNDKEQLQWANNEDIVSDEKVKPILNKILSGAKANQETAIDNLNLYLKLENKTLEAPKKMVELNKTLAEIISGYENALDILQSRLGPELFTNVLRTKDLDNEPMTEGGKPHKDMYTAGSEKVVHYDEIENGESKETEENMPSNKTSKATKTQGKVTVNKEAQPTQVKQAATSEESGNLTEDTEDRTVDVKSISEESIRDGKVSIPEVKENEDSKSQKPVLTAPFKMIEQNQTLAEVIGGYESDLETLKSRLGPQLYTDILNVEKQNDSVNIEVLPHNESVRDKKQPYIQEEDMRDMNDLDTNKQDDKEETSNEKGESETLVYEQKSLKIADGMTCTNDNMLIIEQQALKEPEHQESLDKHDQEKFQETILSEGEIYLSDGEIDQSGFISDLGKESLTKFDSSDSILLYGKCGLSAPLIMAEQSKTLADVIEEYENDLEVLKSNLGLNLYKHILDVRKQDRVKNRKALLHDNSENMLLSQKKKPYSSELEKGSKYEGTKNTDTACVEPVDEKTKKGFKDQQYKTGSKNEEFVDDLINVDELSEGEIDLTLIENTSPASPGSNEIIDSELPLSKYDLAAPKLMKKDNKTLEEVIQNYESDLEILKSSLGSHLCNAILSARKESNESDDAVFTTPDDKLDTTELCNLEVTKNEKEEETFAFDKEPEISESNQHEGQSEENDATVCPLTNQQLKLKATDVRDKDQTNTSVKQRLEDPIRMIAQGKRLEEVIERYENKLEILKSCIGAELYKNLLNAGKSREELDKAELLGNMRDVSKEMQNSETKKNEKDINTEEDLKEHKDDTPQRNVVSGKKRNGFDDERKKEQRCANRIAEKRQETSQKEQQNDMDIDDNNVKMAAVKQMIEHNRTLEDVIDGYEKYLTALKSKLGHELFKHVLEAGTTYIDRRSQHTRTNHKTNSINDIQSDKELSQEQKPKKEVLNVATNEVELISQLKQGSYNSEELLKKQTEHAKVTKAENTEKMQEKNISQEKGDRDKNFKDDAFSINLTKDPLQEPSFVKDLQKKEKRPYELKQLKLPILLADQDTTLQEIIEKYENDLEAFRSRLGPNLAKLVLNVGKKGEVLKKGDDKIQSITTVEANSDRQPTEAYDNNYEKNEDNEGQNDLIKSEDQPTLDEEPAIHRKDQENFTKRKVDNEAVNQMEENDNQSNMAICVDNFERNITLEDLIKKMESESNNLKVKLGPNLTRIFLEQIEEFNSDEEECDDSSGAKKENTSLEEGKKGTSKDYNADIKESEKVRDTDGTKVNTKKEDHVNALISCEDTANVDTLMAPKLMETRNAPLEDVIQNYEEDLSIFKKALGPNLVKILLQGNNYDNDIKKKRHTKDGLKDSEESNPTTEKNETLEEQKPMDNDNQEKTEKQNDVDESNDIGETYKEIFESKYKSEIESNKLEAIFLPLLNEDDDKNLEDIIKKLHKDSNVLSDKLGPNLLKRLLSLDSDSYNVSTDKYDDDICDEEETGSALQKGFDSEDENKIGSEKVKEKDQLTRVEVKESTSDEEENALCHETCDEEFDDLSALDRMEENSLTLEQVIKQYEKNLKRYENCLGSYLSKAILNEKFIPTEAVEIEQEHSNRDDKESKNIHRAHPDEDMSPEKNFASLRDFANKHKESDDDFKALKLEEFLKLVNQGQTLEDILIDYDQGNEAVLLAHTEENTTPISVSDENESYNDQIRELQNQNSDLRHELDNLHVKIGKGLINQLKGKGDVDVTGKENYKNHEEGNGNESLQECEMKPPKINAGRNSNEISNLEAPNIMAKNNQTLEDVVAEYENHLKEVIQSQEQLLLELDILEQSIGPKLYKELREFKEAGEEIDSDKEDQENLQKDSTSQEIESPKKKGKSNFDAINKMAEEEKPLANILEDYKNDLSALERENSSLKKALESVSEDGEDLSDIISKYENKITMLENANKEAEINFEDKHNELQNEIDDLRSTLEKLAQTLRQDFLDDLMKQQDSDNRLEALHIMEKENKTLAEVVEEYEDNMKKLERERAALQQIASQDEKGASMVDILNDYEDAINNLKEVNKVLNKRIGALTDKLGPRLSKEIMVLCDEKKNENVQLQDRPKVETLAAVKKMEEKKVTLEEVLNWYEDQAKISGQINGEHQYERHFKEEIQPITVNDKSEPNVFKEHEFKPHDTPYTQEISDGGQEAIDKSLQTLYDKIGVRLVADISELDDKTYEELEKKDKRPYALRTMKTKNEKLEDVLKAYEKTLFDYGLLDNGKIEGPSLGSEPQAAFEEDVMVEEELQYGAQASDYFVERKDDDDNELAKLKQKLDEEKLLREKYQKDVEDLLTDIVNLKMKNASGEDVEKGDIEKEIKEENKKKQEYKQLMDELSKEKYKNKGLEKENDDLTTDIRNMEKKMKALESNLEQMHGSAKSLERKDGEEVLEDKVKELLMKNEELEKELEGMKNQLKENEESHKMEKTILQQQSENEKRDTIKSLLEAKAEVEIKLQEQLANYHELEERFRQVEVELNNLRSTEPEINGDDEINSGDEEKFAQLKLRNETLKEQLDMSEEAMKDALQKYQDEIKSLEIEKSKLDDEKKHEIELLKNKLDLEKAAVERLKKDYDEMLKKEKQREQDVFEKDLERERRRFEKNIEEQLEDFERKQNIHKQEIEDAKEKSRKEKAELINSLQEEKDGLQKNFEEQMKKKEEEHQKVIDDLREKLEDQLITQKAEMNVQFRQEKTELKANIEKNIYGEELQKNIDLESDFQNSLSKVLKDHANEIEEIEKEMRQAEERFKELKLELLEGCEKEKQKEAQQHDKEKQSMEATIENLLKEIIKLKHQRKEMRQQYRIEKQTIEEFSEKERNEIVENMERSKNELVTKIKEDHGKEHESEKKKYETIIRELQEALERAEAKRKELEEKLRNESKKTEEASLNNKSTNERSSDEILKEVKVIKRGIEMEYEQKLSIEKQRFEDTLQGLKREVGNLQEKRKIIQERVYNQEAHSSERHVIEKSIANYKLEVLAKLEGEMANRLERERKPLEEEVKELQIENEELKRQRWEMKAQFRREKAALEEQFEKEKEVFETNLNKEKEEWRKRLEAKLQKEKLHKGLEVKVSRSASPVLGEHSPRIDNTVRMLKQENLSLASQNSKHEMEIEQLTDKLKLMEMNFKEMVETEKLKAEEMKRIQEQIPKAEAVDLKLTAPEYKQSLGRIQDDEILHTLQEKDRQIHQLLETKRYYESVLGELGEEAGLFELDRNQTV